MSFETLVEVAHADDGVGNGEYDQQYGDDSKRG